MRRWIIILLLAPSMGWAQLLSPGPLAKDHRKIDGDGNCSKCHVRGKGVTNTRCLDCHKVLGKRVRAKKGFHGRKASRRCVSCHKDHLGLNAALVRWPGGSAKRFSHNQAGYTLRGAHREVKCRDCHQTKRITDSAARKINGTYLGLPRDCATCHRPDNPHGEEFKGQKCTDCHSEKNWKASTQFDHDKTDFPLKGQHQQARCESCHTEGHFKGAPSDCVGCHERPHPASTNFSNSCESCHTPAKWSKIIFPKKKHDFFALKGGHKIACDKCHGSKGNRAVKPNCVSCHKDVHRGRLGKDCGRCHSINRWRDVRKSAVDHDKTRFPLKGLHRKVPCRRCHIKGKMAPLPHKLCTDCHQDPHQGEVGTACADCHNEHGFQPSTYRLASHTTFPLKEAHAVAPCNECHRIGKGRRAKWDFRKEVKECTECHKDVHDGQFKPRGCQDCHEGTTWVGAKRFDHQAAWPLKDQHAEVACVHCHEDGQYADTPKECADCHGTPHLGQFTASDPVKGCADCHQPTQWKGEFDHASIWPLEGAHEDTKCAECHREVTVADGRVTTAWRLGFNDCAHCHASAHEAQQW